MSAIPVRLAGVDYPSRKAATEAIQKVLHGAPLNTPLEGEELALAAALFDRHPERDEKAGAGVAGFQVRMNHGIGWKAPTRGFHVERLDGSFVDWSYKSALAGKPRPIEQRLMTAARQTLLPALNEAKRDHFIGNADGSGRVPCELTGHPVTREEAEIDHLPPLTFEVIWACFLASKAAQGAGASARWLADEADSPLVDRLADERLAREWVAFHDELVAREGSLRIVSSEAHRRARRVPLNRARRPVMPAL